MYCPKCYANNRSDRDPNDLDCQMYREGVSINLKESTTDDEMKSIRRILRNEEPEASWVWEKQRSLLEKCIRKRVGYTYYPDLT